MQADSTFAETLHASQLDRQAEAIPKRMGEGGGDLPASDDDSLTAMLDAWRAGDGAAFSELLERSYAELKRIAAQRLRQGGQAVSLSATDLLHEAALRAMESDIHWKNRAHYFASLSLCMRAVLVDAARARMSAKRGGGLLRVTLTDVEADTARDIADLVAFDEALSALEKLDSRSSAALHLVHFSGLERREVAAVLGVSVPTIDRELRFARAWVSKRLDTHA